MDIKGTLVGAGAVVLLAGGIFGAAAVANAGDPAPSPVVLVEPTAVEKVTPPVVVAPEPVAEPEPVVIPEVVVPEPEPVVEPAPVEPAPVEEAPFPEGGIPAPKEDPYANPQNIRPTPPSADVDQP